METNGQFVKTSVNNRPQNKKMLRALVGVIILLTVISVVYIIIFPKL